jgi:hypothetical protein
MDLQEETNLVEMRERWRGTEKVGRKHDILSAVPLRLLRFTDACPARGEGRPRGALQGVRVGHCRSSLSRPTVVGYGQKVAE